MADPPVMAHPDDPKRHQDYGTSVLAVACELRRAYDTSPVSPAEWNAACGEEDLRNSN